MSTRLLLWNIQKFSIKKLAGKPTETPVQMITGQTISQYQKSDFRLSYIMSNVSLTNPDIFVVIEVSSGIGDLGSLVTAGGEQGSQQLLTYLRLLNKNWCLVPPLKLVEGLLIEGATNSIYGEKPHTEAIAVFYRSDKVDFIGPYIWPLPKPPAVNNSKTVAVPNVKGNQAGPYPPTWQACLPANNYYAGQFEFFNKAGEEMQFPTLGTRSPFLVKFTEKGTGRLLSLYCVHFPPNQTVACRALAQLTDYVQAQTLANNELVMILGDLNINGTSMAMDDLAVIRDETKKLTPLFDSDSNLNTSLYNKTDVATPTNYLWTNMLLDNVLYRYGTNLAGTKMLGGILDRVATYPLLMTPMNTILNTADPNKVFRRFMNFGKLGPAPGGTSDHLALLVIV